MKAAKYRAYLRAHRPAVLLVLIFVLSIPLITPYLRGDGVEYYAWLHSPVIDHDLQFEDEYKAGDPVFVGNVVLPDGELRPMYDSPTGHTIDQASVGPAVMWAPFFLTAHGIVELARALGSGTLADGYSSLYLWLVAFGSALYAFLGLFISFRIAGKFLDTGPALLGTLVIWGASSLPVYQYFLPFWPFASGLFVAALLLLVWHRAKDWKPKRWLLIGVLAGLLVSIHPVGIAWLALPAGSFLGLDPGSRKERLRAFAIFAGGGLLGALPSLVGKWIVNGSPLATGYAGTEWTFLRPSLLRVLFGAEHGLVSWTPIAGVALVGLWWIRRHRDRRLATGLLLVFAAMTYFVASYATPEQSSFGNRFFVLFIPGFVIGAGGAAQALWERRKAVAIGACALLVVWNALFAFQWAWGLTPKRGPVNWADVVRNQFTAAPRELVHAAALFVTDRQQLIQIVQDRDAERLQAGMDTSYRQT